MAQAQTNTSITMIAIRDRHHGTSERISGAGGHSQSDISRVPLLNRTVLPICSIEVSPHGDLLDEQKGSAAGRVAQGRAGRTYHERARSEGGGGKRAAVSPPEEAVPRTGYPWPAPCPAGAPRQPAPGPAGSRADRRAHDHDLRRLQ